jgi:teichuronic acid biosynthesis glycosyltransferase TuaH
VTFPDLIFVSLENWDDVWRRNQFICSTLASRHPGSKILFVGLPRDLSNDLRKGRFAAMRRHVSADSTRRLVGTSGIANVPVIRPLKFLPDTLSPCRAVNEAIARRQVRAAARRFGLRRPVLWINSHYAQHMVGRVGGHGLIYDITDDWIEMDQPDWLRERVRRLDHALCVKADAVIVCSEQLHRSKRDLAADRLHLIANGVNAEHYASVRTLPRDQWPAAAREWTGPVFGYTGTVHPDRVDVELVYQVASTLSAGTFVFVGPDHLTDSQRQKLLSTGRVVLHGPVAYSEIPGFMAAFDVLITPHRMSAFVESLQPIKLWEYLAAGKPIVSTDVAGFRDHVPLVRIARTADAFGQALQAALNDSPESAQRRQSIAASNSWSARVDAVEAIIRRVSQSSSELKQHVSPLQADTTPLRVGGPT